MKKIILSLVVALLSGGLFAQAITSITVIPSPPTTGTALKAVVVTTFPSGPCSLTGSYPTTWQGDSIVIFDPLYCYEGTQSGTCTHTDTFDIGPLAAGNYTARSRLTSTASAVPCGSAIMSLLAIEFQSFTVIEGSTGIRSPQQLAVSISPNPVTDNVHFSFTRNGAAEITLLDLSGKTVKNVTFQLGSEMTLNIADLPANVYFYTIKTAEQSVSGKILVE